MAGEEGERGNVGKKMEQLIVLHPARQMGARSGVEAGRAAHSLPPPWRLRSGRSHPRTAHPSTVGIRSRARPRCALGAPLAPPARPSEQPRRALSNAGKAPRDLYVRARECGAWRPDRCRRAGLPLVAAAAPSSPSPCPPRRAHARPPRHLPLSAPPPRARGPGQRAQPGRCPPQPCTCALREPGEAERGRGSRVPGLRLARWRSSGGRGRAQMRVSLARGGGGGGKQAARMRHAGKTGSP